MVQLLEHYFSEQAGQARYRLMRRRASNEQPGWRYLDIINRMIDRPRRALVSGYFARPVCYFVAGKGNIATG